MFTGYGLATCGRPLDSHFLPSISRHQMPSPCQRIPSMPAIGRAFLDGHSLTSISGRQIASPYQKIPPNLLSGSLEVSGFSFYCGFLSLPADEVPSQPFIQVVRLFLAHVFPPLANQLLFPALRRAAPRSVVCGVPFSRSAAEYSHAGHHRFPQGGDRRSIQYCISTLTVAETALIGGCLQPDLIYLSGGFTYFSRLLAPFQRTAAAPARFCRHVH